MRADTKIALGAVPLLHVLCSSAPQQGKELLWAWNKDKSKRKRAWWISKSYQHPEMLLSRDMQQCWSVLWAALPVCDVAYGILLCRAPLQCFSWCSITGYSEVAFLCLSNFEARINFSLQV